MISFGAKAETVGRRCASIPSTDPTGSFGSTSGSSATWTTSRAATEPSDVVAAACGAVFEGNFKRKPPLPLPRIGVSTGVLHGAAVVPPVAGVDCAALGEATESGAFGVGGRLREDAGDASALAGKGVKGAVNGL